MTNIAYLLALVLSLAQGHYFLRYVWSSDLRAPAMRLLHASLSVGAGLGLSSLTYFGWRLLGQRESWGLVAADSLLVLILAVLARRVGRAPATPSPQPPERRHRLGWLVDSAFVAGLVASVASHLSGTLANPHGQWDAWAIWNLRARFLFRGQQHWTDAFSPALAWSHPDYPLLVSATVARLWTYGGAESHAAPSLVGLLFAFAALGLLVSAVWTLRGRMQGMLAGVALLASGTFIGHAASQYADVPLAYYFLAAVSLLSLSTVAAARAVPAVLVLAGTMAGFAAWTKNEGLLFLLAFGVASGAVWLASPRARAGAKAHFLSLLAGLLVVLPVLVYFKVALAPPNDLMSPSVGPSSGSKLLDLTRHRMVLSAYWAQFNSFGKGAPGILVGLLVVAGSHWDRATARAVLAPCASLVLMLGGYYGVYLMTPHDLGWHLATSLDRLVIQVWPLAVLATFVSLRLHADSSDAGDPAPEPARSPATPVSGKADAL